MEKEIKDHFKFLSQMDVKEYILYRTWHQINWKKWNKSELKRINFIKNNIWIPREINDYKKLKPKIIIPSNKKEHLDWRILRFFTSSAPTYSTPGRGIRITIIDEITNQFIGIAELVSDFAVLKPRDVFIGWNKKIKEEGMLKYIAMGSTIVPTQPLGFSYVGGKLISLCLCSNVVEDVWNSKYNEPLLGITTTSLYGGFSQYTNLKYWKKCGTTEGKIKLEPNDEINVKLRHWMRDNYPVDFEKAKNASRMKTRISYFCYSKMKVKPPENNAPRGVYFCELYEDSLKYLNKTKQNFGKKKFDNRIEVLVDLWKKKYANKRVKNLLKNGRYSKETLFYDDLMNLTWKETKEKYILKKNIKNKRKNTLDLFFK